MKNRTKLQNKMFIDKLRDCITCVAYLTCAISTIDHFKSVTEMSMEFPKASLMLFEERNAHFFLQHF